MRKNKCMTLHKCSLIAIHPAVTENVYPPAFDFMLYYQEQQRGPTIQ